MKLYCKSTPTEGEHAYFTKVGGKEFRINLDIKKRLTGKQVGIPEYSEGELYFSEEKGRYIRNRYIYRTTIYDEVSLIATLPNILGGGQVELSRSYKIAGTVEKLPAHCQAIDTLPLTEKMEVDIATELQLLPPVISAVRRKDRVFFTTPSGRREEIFHEGYIGDDCIADYEKSAEYAGSFNYTQTVYVAVPKN